MISAILLLKSQISGRSRVYPIEFYLAHEILEYQEAIEEQKSHIIVLDVDEDIQLEEEVQFDIFEFMAKQDEGKRVEGIDSGTPPAIVQHLMEEFYMVPVLGAVSMLGDVILNFSTKIVQPDPLQIKLRLEKDTVKRELEQQAMKEDEKMGEESESIEKLLKRSGSIVMKLLPGIS